ncbi:MAG: DUF2079 domain-containing protein [Chitinispirillaceae bacterium]|nr:DUF2079 domain-containing protein [Chitinispirillaceae bacterium]
MITLALFIAYCVVFSFLSIKKYQAFNCDLDMGNMLQAFYNTLDGRFMEMTWNGQGPNGCMWMGHTEIIYLALLPFFAVFPSAITLLILQTIAIALGGIAVYAIARRLVRDRVTPIVLALCYWLFPLLAAINLVDFHADAFIIAPHLFAWYFLRTGRDRWFWVAIGIGILVKEHVFLFNALLGTMLFATDRKRASILLILSAMQFFLFTPFVQLGAGIARYQLNLAAHVVGDPLQRPLAVIADYGKHLWDNLFTHRAGFVLMIALILNVSLVKFPRGLLMIVPWLLIFIAAGSVQNHRHAIMIAPLFITLVEGVARISFRRQRLFSMAGVLFPVIVMLVISPDSLLGVNIRELFSPVYRNVFHYRYTKHDAIADSLVRSIPAQVSTAADTHLRTKLADRQWSYTHPAPADSTTASYYLFDFFEKREYDDAWPARKRAAALLQNGSFSRESYIDGLLLIKRNPAAAVEPLALLPVDAGADEPPAGYDVRKVSLSVVNNRFTITMQFRKGPPDDSLKHAFISFFIKTETSDTVRVLHLASYTLARLEFLPAGVYEETFSFNVPQGTSLHKRRQEIWLYKKEGYLPFFSRPHYQHACLWQGAVTTVSLTYR